MAMSLVDGVIVYFVEMSVKVITLTAHQFIVQIAVTWRIGFLPFYEIIAKDYKGACENTLHVTSKPCP